MFRRVLIVIGALLLLGGVIAAGCTDTGELEDRIAALEQAGTEDGVSAEDLAALQEQMQRTSMIAALQTLSSAGLHDIDEQANAGEVPEAGTGGIEAALIAIAGIQWPDELQGTATEVQTALEALLEAMASEDPKVIGPPAAAAHEAQHDFDHEAKAHLRELAGLPAEEEEHDTVGDASATPTAVPGAAAD